MVSSPTGSPDAAIAPYLLMTNDSPRPQFRDALGVVILGYRDDGPSQSLAGRLVADGCPPSSVVTVLNVVGPECDVERDWAIDASSANRGYAGGMNAGGRRLLRSGAQQLAFLTHDVDIRYRDLLELGDCLSQHKDAGAVGPVLYDGTDGTLFSAGGGIRPHGVFHEQTIDTTRCKSVAWLDGAVLLVRADAFEALGGFDECFFLYGEDVDFSLRLRRSGWSCLLAGMVGAGHQPGRANAGRARAYSYLNTRNVIEVLRREYGWRAALLACARQILRSRARDVVTITAVSHFLIRRFGPPPARFVSGSDIVLSGSR